MQYIKYLVCIVYLITYAATASTSTDSLQVLLTKPMPDTARIDILVKLSKQLRNMNTREAEKYALQALSLSQQHAYIKGVSGASDVLGVIYMNQADFQKALLYLFTALRMNEHLKDTVSWAGTCNNIGSVFFHYKNYDQALSYYQKSLSLKFATGNKKGTSSSFINIGSVYMNRPNPDLETCINYYNKALNNARLYNDTYNISIALMNLGEAYIDKKEYDAALSYYFAANSINKQGDQFHAANTNYAIGKIFMLKNHLQIAETYLKKGLNIALSNGTRPIQLQCYKNLSQLYEKEKKTDTALLYYKKYHLLSDSIYNSEIESKMTSLQSKYESEKKDSRIALLEKDKAVTEARLYKERLIRNIFIVGFLLILVFVGILIRNVVLSRKMNRILTIKNSRISLQRLEINRKNQELSNFNKELMKENISAKYKILKSKIDPHFLFNSLNILSDFIVKDPGQALEYVIKFSRLYRKLLDHSDHQLVTIKEELTFVKDYIYIQKMRFKDNVHYEVIMPELENLKGMIPPFSAQILVENAIKHNIVSARQKLYITIIVSHDGILIRNNLQPRHDEISSTQTGQINISARYELVDGAKPTFGIVNNNYEAFLPIIYHD